MWVGEEKIGMRKYPLKYMFKSEDDVFIRVETEKNRGFPRGTVNMPGKTAELSKILSGSTEGRSPKTTSRTG